MDTQAAGHTCWSLSLTVACSIVCERHRSVTQPKSTTANLVKDARFPDVEATGLQTDLNPTQVSEALFAQVILTVQDFRFKHYL